MLGCRPRDRGCAMSANWCDLYGWTIESIAFGYNPIIELGIRKRFGSDLLRYKLSVTYTPLETETAKINVDDGKGREFVGQRIEYAEDDSASWGPDGKRCRSYPHGWNRLFLQCENGAHFEVWIPVDTLGKTTDGIEFLWEGAR
jgi:hypothetical protein